MKSQRLLDVNINADFMPLAIVLGIIGFLYVSRNK